MNRHLSLALRCITRSYHFSTCSQLSVVTRNNVYSYFCRHRAVSPTFKACRAWHSISDLSSSPIAEDWKRTECRGCGAPFQSEDPGKPGYICERPPKEQVPTSRKRSNKSLSDEEYNSLVSELPTEYKELLDADGVEKPAQLEDETETTKHECPRLCQRCYDLRYHNRLTTESSPEFLRKTLQYASLNFLKTKRNPLIVAVIDITDLPFSLGSLPKLFQESKGVRLVLAANKFDLLPPRAREHENRIRDWITQYVKGLGLPVKHVSLISAKKGWGVSGLLRWIAQERMPTDDVYMVGCTNVGKSALINRILTKVGTLEARMRKITISAAPGTTMGTIRIPLREINLSENQSQTDVEDWKKRRFVQRERFLIDTPGVINDQQMIHLLPFDDQKKLLKVGQLNPVTFRLTKGKSFLLKPFVRLDLVDATDAVYLTLFSPIAPHVTKISKLDSKTTLADDDDKKTQDTVSLLDPSVIQLRSMKPMPDLLTVRGTHPSRACVDLAFSSCGWIAVAGRFEKATFRIWLPEAVEAESAFSIRTPPFLPYEFKGVIRKFYGSGERARQ